MAVAKPRRPRFQRHSPRKAGGEEPRLGTLVKRAEQEMVRAKSAALKPVGVTLAQYVALQELELQPGVTAASLARACFVTPQAMMVLLNSMEQQGLIARSVHARHANVLELHMTDVGREALYAARNRIEPIESRVWALFSPKELAVFREHLSRFIEAFVRESKA
jgi:DNA-binding MarR family transcriptional regulator